MSWWRRAIGWIITPLFLLNFWIILVFFHVMQLIVHPFSLRAQKHVLDVMNLSIVLNIRFCAGAIFRVVKNGKLPEGRSVIVVANHQSMYDIPMMMWIMRKRNLGFIAKKELGRGIPSISFALRHLGSVLIDRRQAQQAIAAIEGFGRRKEQEREVACIFPEGTRARDGKMKKFKETGLQALLRSMPTAILQPVVVDGNWELLRYRFLPVPFRCRITLTFLDPIEPASIPSDRIIDVVEGIIRHNLEGAGTIIARKEEGPAPLEAAGLN